MLQRSFRTQRSEQAFSSWHIVIDRTVAAACIVLSASAPESPQALGNSFDATGRLKCLGFRERSSGDEQSQQQREIETADKWRRVASVSEPDSHLAGTIPPRGDLQKGVPFPKKRATLMPHRRAATSTSNELMTHRALHQPLAT